MPSDNKAFDISLCERLLHEIHTTFQELLEPEFSKKSATPGQEWINVIFNEEEMTRKKQHNIFASLYHRDYLSPRTANGEEIKRAEKFRAEVLEEIFQSDDHFKENMTRNENLAAKLKQKIEQYKAEIKKESGNRTEHLNKLENNIKKYLDQKGVLTENQSKDDPKMYVEAMEWGMNNIMTHQGEHRHMVNIACINYLPSKIREQLFEKGNAVDLMEDLIANPSNYHEAIRTEVSILENLSPDQRIQRLRGFNEENGLYRALTFYVLTRKYSQHFLASTSPEDGFASLLAHELEKDGHSFNFITEILYSALVFSHPNTFLSGFFGSFEAHFENDLDNHKHAIQVLRTSHPLSEADKQALSACKKKMAKSMTDDHIDEVMTYLKKHPKDDYFAEWLFDKLKSRKGNPSFESHKIFTALQDRIETLKRFDASDALDSTHHVAEYYYQHFPSDQNIRAFSGVVTAHPENAEYIRVAQHLIENHKDNPQLAPALLEMRSTILGIETDTNGLKGKEELKKHFATRAEKYGWDLKLPEIDLTPITENTNTPVQAPPANPTQNPNPHGINEAVFSGTLGTVNGVKNNRECFRTLVHSITPEIESRFNKLSDEEVKQIAEFVYSLPKQNEAYQKAVDHEKELKKEENDAEKNLLAFKESHKDAKLEKAEEIELSELSAAVKTANEKIKDYKIPAKPFAQYTEEEYQKFVARIINRIYRTPADKEPLLAALNTPLLSNLYQQVNTAVADIVAPQNITPTASVKSENASPRVEEKHSPTTPVEGPIETFPSNKPAPKEPVNYGYRAAFGALGVLGLLAGYASLSVAHVLPTAITMMPFAASVTLIAASVLFLAVGIGLGIHYAKHRKTPGPDPSTPAVDFQNVERTELEIEDPNPESTKANEQKARPTIESCADTVAGDQLVTRGVHV